MATSSANGTIGALRPADMITSRIPLEKFIEQGLNPLLNEKDKHVKILVDVKKGLSPKL